MKAMNSKLTIGNIILKNRVVVPPMASQTADYSGYVTEATLDHYARLSTSRAAMVMVEYTYVHLSGMSEKNQLGISSDKHVAGLKKLSSRIKKSGGIPALQLTHAGGKSHTDLTGGRLISPSGVKVPSKGNEFETPDQANSHDILTFKKSFIEASLRAYNAGFDIVELHAAHGYGLNQWLSPITNKRTDSYGGSRENRFRILVEIVMAINEIVPSLILSVRIPGMDHFDGGHSIEDSITLSKLLEKLGVKIINVSSGMGGWRRPESRSGEGYLVVDAARIQVEVDIAVIGVGGIKTSGYINKSLSEHKFSLAAVGREILNDPSWGTTVGLV